MASPGDFLVFCTA